MTPETAAIMRAIGRLEARVERLISDVAHHGKQLDGLEDTAISARAQVEKRVGTRKRRAARIALALGAVGTIAGLAQVVVQWVAR
jgi:hypothetical protein